MPAGPLLPTLPLVQTAALAMREKEQEGPSPRLEQTRVAISGAAHVARCLAAFCGAFQIKAPGMLWQTRFPRGEPKTHHTTLSWRVRYPKQLT